MIPPRLKLVDGNLELLSAAVAGGGALEALLGVSVADDWSGFPEALPVLRASYEENPNGHKWGSLFFVEPHVRTLVGFGGFKGPPSPEAVVEIGYAIAPAFQGQGLATDAVAQMVRRAFEDTTVRAVDAHTLGHANPSTRVLEKSGFRKIGEADDPDDGVVWHWRRERPALVVGEPEFGGDVFVRRLRSDDTDLLRSVRLAALEESPEAFGETLEGARAADWRARANDGATLPDRAVFIAVSHDRPVGMVFVKCASPTEPAFLGGMWVAPEFRRRGVGRALVHQGLNFLRLAGQTELSLWVTRGHHRVLAFYKTLGFRDTGVTSALRPGSGVLIDELRSSLR